MLMQMGWVTRDEADQRHLRFKTRLAFWPMGSGKWELRTGQHSATWC